MKNLNVTTHGSVLIIILATTKMHENNRSFSHSYAYTGFLKCVIRNSNKNQAQAKIHNKNVWDASKDRKERSRIQKNEPNRLKRRRWWWNEEEDVKKREELELK